RRRPATLDFTGGLALCVRSADFCAKEVTMTSKDFTDPVEGFLEVYGRATDDLLGAKVLSAPGVFEGERQFIQFADRDYDVDRHWAFKIKREQCALIVV